MTHYRRRASARSVLLATAVLLAGPARLPAQQPDGRAPVPDTAATGKAMELVREVYQEEYERAKTPAQRVALARRMMAQAGQPGNDSVSRYVLLWVGRNLATAAGDAPTAVLIVDRMAAGFRVDGLAMKADAMAEAAGSARSTSQKKALAAATAGLIDARR